MTSIEKLEYALDDILLNGEFGESATAGKMCELFGRFLQRLLCFDVYDERLREIIAKASAELAETPRVIPHEIVPALDKFTVGLKRAQERGAGE